MLQRKQQANKEQQRVPPPGLHVGTPEPEQLMRAINDAYPDLKQPLVSDDSPEGVDALQQAVEAELAKLNKQQPGPTTKKPAAAAVAVADGPSSSGPSSSSLLPDPATMKALVKMQGRLLASAPEVQVHRMDVLQRRLAAAMPTSTKINSESKMAASVQQLKSRCALAKGRHDVRYVGYDAAFELIRVLADQNEPNVKAVLKLKLPNEVAGTPLKGAAAAATLGGTWVDPESASEAAAFGCHCEGEFLVSLDVRGVMVEPRRVISLPQSGSDFVVRLGTLLNEITKNWDTVAIEALAASSATALDSTKETPGTSSLFGEDCNPDLPPRKQAGFALALCQHAMKELQRDERGACVIVQWGRGETAAGTHNNQGSSSSSHASKAAGGKHAPCKGPQREVIRLTLAELDMSAKGRGIQLLNSPGVVDKISAAAEDTTGEEGPLDGGSQRHDILSRLDAVLASLEMTRSMSDRDMENHSFSSIVDKFVRDTNGRLGGAGRSKLDTLLDGGDD